MRDFTLVVLEHAYATSVAATVDILTAACALAPRVGAPPPRWTVASLDGGEVALQGGLRIATSKLAPRGDRSTWIVPGLGLPQAAAIEPRLDRDDAKRLAVLIGTHVGRGGRVAASCAAVFLLGRAGILDGRTVTTTWWLAPLLQRLSAGCTVDADRMVCSDGPITTAGAAFAQTDLMLHLLRDRCGNALADVVARMLLIDARAAQAPFVVPEVLANGDQLVAQLASRVERALPDAPRVAQLASELGMSERTLARHLRRVTGRSAMALIQSVRLRRARTLLESTRLSVDEVAAAVGYEDATALRRMMKRLTGAGPSRYRATESRY